MQIGPLDPAVSLAIPLNGAVLPALQRKASLEQGATGRVGGVAVTAVGLIFSGTKSDSTFRAYDKHPGKHPDYYRNRPQPLQSLHQNLNSFAKL
ncbi:MAG TPA: hypothetical protein VK638_22795 [Edaphobacter sp.]|nr:hypothetical protein [Edaphobacter sp.]